MMNKMVTASGLSIRPRGDKKPGEVQTGYNTLFEADGKEIKGILSAVLTFLPGDAVKADLNIFVETVELDGVIISYTANNPETGKANEVESIRFKNGDRFEFE
jgi:hypothetical protein